MKTCKPPSDASIAKVAEARADGRSWEYAGLLVKRSEESVRKWPRRYPGQWDRARQAADNRVVEDAAAEAVIVLRQLLRSASERTQLAAAKAIATMRVELARSEAKKAAKEPPPLPPRIQAMVEMMQSQTPEQEIRMSLEWSTPESHEQLLRTADEHYPEIAREFRAARAQRAAYLTPPKPAATETTNPTAPAPAATEVAAPEMTTPAAAGVETATAPADHATEMTTSGATTTEPTAASPVGPEPAESARGGEDGRLEPGAGGAPSPGAGLTGRP